ncbi:zinc-binding protein A33-like [Protopterus annectens]|uniref:zinc-binding protein A33-like n=1 Tax=Protopterus annectens TaxID=7888 RepID=UPI001CF9AED0|nr:zinc-binding protein A33-like [Protopterus annectens]
MQDTRMASIVLAESLTSEVTCPICLDFYKDPVRLECEHNFCRACISSYWKNSESIYTCPQCKEIFPQLQLKSNRLLASIVERVRQLHVDSISQKESGLLLCEKHDEKLKLYCEDDQEPICVVCGVSRDHKKHKLTPIHEATQLFKEKLQAALSQLEKQKDSIGKFHSEQMKTIQEVKDSALTLKEHITSEYEKLQRFLEADRDALLAELHNEEEILLQKMEDNLRGINEEQASLEQAMAHIEERLKEEDSSVLLLNVKTMNDRLRKGIKEVSVQRGNLSTGRFHGPIQYAAWKKMRNVIHPVPVQLTFNPTTANPYLVLSEDLTTVRYSFTSEQLPENPERFDFCACVLASQGFTSGNHYWEVDVGNYPDWDIGVAAESVGRDGWIILDPENGFWTFGHVACSRVGVYLDWEGGQLSFYDASSMSHLHTVMDNFMEKLYPFFYPSAESSAKPLQLLYPRV